MRKQRILSLILLVAVLWLTQIPAAAATQYSDGVYTFERTDYDTAIITDCNLTEEKIEVPELVLGYPVVGIGDYAFFSNSYVQEVTLPSAVTAIGAYAFADNEGLVSVTIPLRCESIAENAFWNCPNVTFRCRYDSAAHLFAKENHIPCVFTDDVKLGNTNGDRDINITDATVIQRHAAGLEYLDGIRLLAADVNRDGQADITDATALQKYLAGYEVPSPIGQPIEAENGRAE